MNDSDRPESPKPTFRATLHRQLEVSPDRELSAFNRIIVVVILTSVAIGIAGTEPVVQQRLGRTLLVLELCLGLIFVIEFVGRLWCAGLNTRFAGTAGALRYLLRPLTLIDLLVIVSLVAPAFGAEVVVLRMLRLLRLVALAKFGRYSQALKLLAAAFHKRRYELVLSASIALLILLLSSTGMYLLEARTQPDAFGSIPRALWWSVATLTTVGYGDVYPVTTLGRLFAGITAVAGIGLIALPAGILASAFSELTHRNPPDA